MYNLDPLENNKKLTKDEAKKQSKLKWQSFKKLIHYLNYRKGMLFWIITTSILSALCLTISTYLLGYITDEFLNFDFLSGSNFDELKFIGSICLLIVFAILKEIFWYTSSYLSIRAGIIASAIMRLDAYKAIMKMPISFFESTNTGKLMSIISNDIDNISSGLSTNFNNIISTIVITITSIGFMLYYSVYLTLITIALFPVLFFVMFFFLKKIMVHYQSQQKNISNLNGYIEENLAAHHLIKSLDYNAKSNEEFKKKNLKLYKSSLKANVYSDLAWPYATTAINFLQLIIVVIAALLANANIGTGSNKNFSPGVIISFVFYIRMILNNFVRVLENISIMQLAIVSSTRVFNVIKLKPEIDESKLKTIENIRGDVSFENVNFSYTNDPDSLQLINASFQTKKGQVFAIVGPTGAGKTTIINLLSKFYLPNSGTIKIDNYKSSEINESSWRNQISIVLQDTFLFQTTIMENLRYGNLEASDKEIIEAAHLSHAHEFIKKLKNGYDEIIEEGGANLSQGERQLLAITRAIIANKNILVLDEATSNVDTRTEKIIQKAMLNLMKGKTSFIIAHRLSTVINADQILVVKENRIIERGTHKELLEYGGFYKELYESSFSEN
ncbi:ABC transporter ATP-binding protein/permease [Mycoplasma enhydrae]|uniref:ABC transporter ATP-binding protein n=1 Tax=Mycoplasma enhydrae TaxID=2499220 RepID=UPI00197BD8D5|nr:ABC transporter ATP-binding protein [Mycoplasma enhydrae]MBN4089226.1 ABC transporter ATP-binding protein [Mycoplasma enhydrae]MCV3753670.1 ABC transporter ATP-binding protein/permease [Mycoplasma enhydrae]